MVRAMIIVVIATAAARANPEASQLAPLIAAWQDGDTARVIADADHLLATPPRALSTADHVAILMLRGAALAVDGRGSEASATFARVFALDPEADLPPYLRSPALRSSFEAARGTWRATTDTEMREQHGAQIAAIRFEARAPADARGGRALHFDVVVTDPAVLGRRVVFAYKRHRELDYTSTVKPVGPRLAFSIPDQVTASAIPYALDYYLVLRADNGYDLATVGSARTPRSLEVRAGAVPSPPPPLYGRTWFWLGVGAVALGAGYVTYRSIDVGPQHASTTISGL